MNSDVTSFHLKITGKVRLPNGGVYIKYYDEKNNKTVLIRKGSQSEEIHLIPINQLDRYSYLMNALNEEQEKIARILIDNIDKFKTPIEYINFENGIVIDEENKVIGCIYDKKTGNYEVKYVNEMPALKKSTSVVTKSSQNSNVDSKYISAIESLEKNGRPVEINGYFIDKDTLDKYSKNQELLDQEKTVYKEREIWNNLLKAYKTKIPDNNLVEIHEEKNKKIKQKKKNTLGMQILKASLSGFALGFVLSILFLVAKKFF